MGFLIRYGIYMVNFQLGGYSDAVFLSLALAMLPLLSPPLNPGAEPWMGRE